jgi:hypothetical protein
MVFGCRRRAPAPSPPRPTCMLKGCNRRALKCDTKSPGTTLLSYYCSDRKFNPAHSASRSTKIRYALTGNADACRQRLGDGMCPTPKDAGAGRYCDDRRSTLCSSFDIVSTICFLLNKMIDRRCHAEGCSKPRICGDSNPCYQYCTKRKFLLASPRFYTNPGKCAIPSRSYTTNTRFLGKQIRATYAPARRNAPQVQRCATRTLPDASSPTAETPLPTTACIAPLIAVLKLNVTASFTAVGGARTTRRARLPVARVGS